MSRRNSKTPHLPGTPTDDFKFSSVDANVAKYWTDPITRREFQDIVDKYDLLIGQLQATVFGGLKPGPDGKPAPDPDKPGMVHKILTACAQVGYLMEESGLTQEQAATAVVEFLKRHAKDEAPAIVEQASQLITEV